jgi:hypothetical protein
MASEVVPAVGPDYGRSLFLRGQRVAAPGKSHFEVEGASYHLWPLASLDYASIRFSLHDPD